MLNFVIYEILFSMILVLFNVKYIIVYIINCLYLLELYGSEILLII